MNNMSRTMNQTNATISPDQGVVNPSQVVPARRDRRNRSRVACEGLSCTLGRVLGLSATGMRVQARGRCRIQVDGRVTLTLRDSENQLRLSARIAWVKKTGLFQYEAGMEFVDLTFDQRRDLALMAQMAMPKLLMRKGALSDLPTGDCA